MALQLVIFVQAISGALEREIGLINASREAALDATDGDSKKRILTTSGKAFTWADLPRGNLTFTQCTAVMDEKAQAEKGNREEEGRNIDEILHWIENL